MMSDNENVRNILFITATRIGDAVLSTGLLGYIANTYPNARVTVACGHLPAPLFQDYPQLECLIPMKKKKRHGHWIGLWKHVVSTKWDIVIDLRNSVVSRLVRAKKRYIFGNHINKTEHKVQQNASVMHLSGPPDPLLWFSKDLIAQARELIPKQQKVLAIGPAANWHAKTWPSERFIEVISYLTADGGKMSGAYVAVFAAPGEEDIALPVLKSVSPDRQINIIGEKSLALVAACLSLCDLYVGNDSGLMHCAAACGVKTLGLFGPSYPHIYAPWGKGAHYVRTPESFDELINYEGYTSKTAPNLMETLEVDTVKEKLDEIL